jgi:hypothetical protein
MSFREEENKFGSLFICHGSIFPLEVKTEEHQIQAVPRSKFAKDIKIDSGSYPSSTATEDGKLSSYFYLLLSIILKTMRILRPEVIDSYIYYFNKI